MEVLKTQNLNVSVWHNDTFGRNTFLGEVDLDLSELDFSNTQINEYALKARVTTFYLCVGIVEVIFFLIRHSLFSPHLLQASAQTSAPSSLHLMDGRGQMRVALRFLPQTSHSELMIPQFVPVISLF